MRKSSSKPVSVLKSKGLSLSTLCHVYKKKQCVKAPVVFHSMDCVAAGPLAQEHRVPVLKQRIPLRY